MTHPEGYQKDIESIRHLMERSVKFISLSGLSGILSGIYALIGALAAWWFISVPLLPAPYDLFFNPSALLELSCIAVAVLIISVISGVMLSRGKAKKKGIEFWDATAKRLVLNLAIPLITGGLFIVILLFSKHFLLISPSFLIFYGLALINASPNLYEEVRYLGYSEILLGLLCALAPGYGLIFWATGFGLFHILYGTIMYRKYDA